MRERSIVLFSFSWPGLDRFHTTLANYGKCRSTADEVARQLSSLLSSNEQTNSSRPWLTKHDFRGLANAVNSRGCVMK